MKKIVIRRPFKNIVSLKNLVNELTGSAWEAMPDISDSWVELADAVILIKNNSKNLGFFSFKVIDKNQIILLATMINKDYQNRGLSKELIRAFIVELFCHPYKYKINFFKPIYFALRTPNPRVYEMVSFMDTFPSINGRKPTEKEVSIAEKVMKIMSPKLTLNKNNFHVEKILSNHKGLIYNLNNYPKAKDNRINKLFEESLKYDGKNNQDILMVVSNINLSNNLLKLFSKFR